jgi:hypothetical protein
MHRSASTRSSLSSRASSYRGAKQTFSSVASLAPQKNGWLVSIKRPSPFRFLGIALRQILVKRNMRARQNFCKGKAIISIIGWGPSAGVLSVPDLVIHHLFRLLSFRFPDSVERGLLSRG